MEKIKTRKSFCYQKNKENFSIHRNSNKLSKEQNLYFIYLADKFSKYEDSLNAFENLINSNLILFQKNERYIFEKSVRLIINNKRTTLKKLFNLSKEAQAQLEYANKQNIFDEEILISLEEEKNFTRSEIINLCNKILNLIDTYLKNAKNFDELNHSENNHMILEKENEAFFYKLKGDLHKYLFQIVEDSNEEHKNFKKAEEYFIESYKIARMELDLFNQTSLSAILTYAEFLYKYKQRSNDALDILIPIYEKEETKNILHENQNSDSNILSLLNDIKVLISTILNSDHEESTIID